MLVGYIRVSTDSDRQVLDLQRDALVAAVVALRQAAADVPDELLAHLSPLGWEHVNLTGDYVWGGQHSMSENTGGLRALRTTQQALATAA